MHAVSTLSLVRTLWPFIRYGRLHASEAEIVAHGAHESFYLAGGLYRVIIDSNARTLNIGRLAATVLPQPAVAALA